MCAGKWLSLAVDTTAAGDYFLAGYLYGVMAGLSESRALDLGAAAAAVFIAGVVHVALTLVN